jgi:hypothetical protein
VWAFQSVFKMVDGAISGATKRFDYIRNIMICNDLRVSGVVLAGCTSSSEPKAAESPLFSAFFVAG